jgi:site-specific DNA-methyltransferase (adenine-specific)
VARFRKKSAAADAQDGLFESAEGSHKPASKAGPDQITILPPQDVLTTLKSQREPVKVTMLDPWYNRGIGGIRDDYDEWLGRLLAEAARFSEHVFLWGFPEIVAGALRRIPRDLAFVAWLTWYFKNCPSVIRGWRSAQQACLHFSRPDAKLYPEHFLNEAQKNLKERGKLRYMPGPASVLEVPLNIGFVGRDEQTGHPSQKPKAVIAPLLSMTTEPGDLVLDPMCGSGTTGAVCLDLSVKAILCDASEEYLTLAAQRLGLATPLRNIA